MGSEMRGGGGGTYTKTHNSVEARVLFALTDNSLATKHFVFSVHRKTHHRDREKVPHQTTHRRLPPPPPSPPPLTDYNCPLQQLHNTISV